MRILHGFNRVFRGKSAHYQGQLAVGCGLDGKPIDPQDVLGGVRTAAVHFHDKLDVFHGFLPEAVICALRSVLSLSLSLPTLALISLGLESERSPADR